MHLSPFHTEGGVWGRGKKTPVDKFIKSWREVLIDVKIEERGHRMVHIVYRNFPNFF
jgi:hypothetical protein